MKSSLYAAYTTELIYFPLGDVLTFVGRGLAFNGYILS